MKVPNKSQNNDNLSHSPAGSRMQMQSGVGDFHENWFEMRMVGLQPDRRSYHSSFVYDKKLFVFGGLDIREGSLDTLYELPLAAMQETILDELDRPNSQALLSMH